jgi:uncharacterized membrane protein required for colicin V production
LSINLFDILFVIVLVAFTLLSFLRGAVMELITLLGLTGGLIAARHYAAPLARQLEPLLSDRNAAELLAFVLVVLLGYFAGVFLAGFGDMLRSGPAGTLSQVLAGMVGFCKGVAVSVAMLWVVEQYVPAFQDELAGSWIGSWLEVLVTYLNQFDVL